MLFCLASNIFGIHLCYVIYERSYIATSDLYAFFADVFWMDVAYSFA